jgi:hypothetical protein
LTKKAEATIQRRLAWGERRKKTSLLSLLLCVGRQISVLASRLVVEIPLGAPIGRPLQTSPVRATPSAESARPAPPASWSFCNVFRAPTLMPERPVSANFACPCGVSCRLPLSAFVLAREPLVYANLMLRSFTQKRLSPIFNKAGVTNKTF